MKEHSNTMDKKINVKRGGAAKLIEKIRVAVARCEGNPALEALAIKEIKEELRRAGIPELTPCDGEAHANPHIDNCGTCMPRWGWVGPEVAIR